jgi:hypothetical protein
LEKATKINKEKAQNELNIEKTKLDDRIALVDASVQDQETAFQAKLAEQIRIVTSKVEEVNTTLSNDIIAKNKETIDEVRSATKQANQSNDDIYLKYDSKIKKIKDVCAQYFSKYEKHLINHQTIVKDLERQQQLWVDMLIKPQELNQARLFAIESRIKENEQTKMNEVEFLKETVKKLIYAIEQNQVSGVKTPPPMHSGQYSSTVDMTGKGSTEPTNLPNLMKPSRSTRGGSRTATTKHGSKSFFRGS